PDDPGGAGHRSDAMGLTGRSRAVQRSGFPDWFPVRHCLPSLWPHLGVHSACIYLLICTRTSKMRQLFPSLTALQRPSENRTLCKRRASASSVLSYPPAKLAGVIAVRSTREVGPQAGNRMLML